MSPPRTVAEPSPLRSRTVTPKSVKSETPEPVYPSPIVDPKWEQVVTFSHQDPNIPHDALSVMTQWAFNGQHGWLNKVFRVKDANGKDVRLWQHGPGNNTLGRDVRLMINPKASRDVNLLPSSHSDQVHITTRLHKVTRSFMQFSAEYRLIEKRERRTRRRLARKNPDELEPFAVGLLGVVNVTMGPPPNRFKASPLPANLHAPGWVSVAPAFASGEYDWITRGDLDFDKMSSQDIESGGWVSTEDYLWKARWSDTDSLRHVTTTKRPLPVLDLLFDRFQNFRDFANIQAFYIALSSEVQAGDLVRIHSVQRTEHDESHGPRRSIVELRMAIVNGKGQRHAAAVRVIDVPVEDPRKAMM